LHLHTIERRGTAGSVVGAGAAVKKTVSLPKSLKKLSDAEMRVMIRLSQEEDRAAEFFEFPNAGQIVNGLEDLGHRLSGSAGQNW